MPQYLSPGVYVEEVDSGSRPIEGVGTAVAAFVGIAERGPFNEPTLVTNWSQYTSTFGEFIDGAYLPHAVFGYFLNGGGSAYIVRVGGDGSPVRLPARAELMAGSNPTLGSYRVSALEGGAAGNELSVEISDVKGAEGEDTSDQFKLVVKRGNRAEETFDGLTTKRGKQNAVTVVNAQSKLIRLEEIAAARRGRAARCRLDQPGWRWGGRRRANSPPDDYVGDPADRTGFGGLEAVDPITMVAVPDLMSAYQRGMIDLEGVQAVQLAMIAHCELMGDRVAILDPPPGLNAQQITGVAGRQGRVRLEVRGAVLALGEGVRSRVGPERLRAAERRHGGYLGPQRQHPRRPQGSGQRGGARRDRARDQHHQGRARPPQPAGHQLHPRVPGAGHPGVGRPDPVERPGVAVSQRAPPLQLPRGVDPQRHPVGGVRAERRQPSGPRCAGRSPASS